MRDHEFVEIKPLDGAELFLHACDVVEPRRLDRMSAMSCALFGLQVFIKIGDRGMRPDRMPLHARSPMADGLRAS
jgi:hypothetical protein